MSTNKGIMRGVKAALQRHRLGELLVIKGVITPDQLKSALKIQKEEKKQLGQIFMESAILTKRQLFWLLARQYALRTSATAIMMFMSFSNFAAKRAYADGVGDVPAKLMLVSTSGSDYSRVGVYPALYGTSEKRSSNLKAFTKWTSMFDRFEREMKSPDAAQMMRTWQSKLQSMRGGSIKSMAQKVNSFVNETRYITDSKNWGQTDYWATPVEFMKRGGDCEDFAIAKYTALRAMGVPEERLRIAIVQDTYKNIPHAVLVVYTEQGAVILDNQIKTLVDAGSGNRYKPIFSINRQAWWLHGKPAGTTMVASAR